MSPIAVVGAGIVGSSVAYHLARLGVAVTLIDRAAAPAAGVTGASFGWIGDAGGDWPGGAQDLRGSVLADYRRLETELPAVAVQWTGSLAWTGAGTRLESGQRWVGRDEIASLEPNLQPAPERAVHTPTDGGVDPVRVTEALVDGARKLGAQVVSGATAISLAVHGGRVDGVLSSAGFHPASTVVLAAGTDVPALCDPLDVSVPVAVSPALLVRVATPPGLVKTIVAGPGFEAREVCDGHVLMTAPHHGALSPAALDRLAHRTVDLLRSAFRGADPAFLLGHRIGKRPMPADGPVLGYVTPQKSVYVAVMHSAVTLAPTAGRLVAQELVTGEPAAELGRCRPRTI